MPAVKRSFSDTDSLSSLTPPSSPAGPKTPIAKREATPDVASSDEDDYDPEPNVKTVSRNTKGAKVPKTPKVKKPKVGGGEKNGEWTAEKKEGLVSDIIALGLKAVNYDEAAAKYGLSKRQLINALQVGRNNLRAKVIKTARDC